MYAFSENFMLALSHDEVVHGKSSMIGKMSGDEWQKFANLRTLYAYMFTHPGTKLLFMGNDLGQYNEWNFTWQLEWELLQHPPHKGLNDTIKALNQLYRSEKALFHHNFSPEGFEWVDAGDRMNSILIYQRKSDVKNDVLMIVCNLNIMPHNDYKIGLYAKQTWELIFNTDDKAYWGSGYEVQKKVLSKKVEWNGRNHHIEIQIPPLSVTVYRLLSSVEDKPKVSKPKTEVKKVAVKPTNKKVRQK
jgi:1,4-alpha-glucan branching enzyme